MDVEYSRTSLIRTSLIRTLANPNDSRRLALRLQTILGTPRQVDPGHCRVSNMSSGERNGKLSGENKGKKAKRPHKTLTIDEKIAILDGMATSSYAVLSERYGVGRSTISDIKKKEPELRQFKRRLTEMGGKRFVKTMKLSTYEELERAVFIWFRQAREKGIPVSGPILQEKGSSAEQEN